MTSEEKLKYQYRFSGYQLPMIQLDATGPQYVQIAPHPYYTNQPAYWSERALIHGKTFQTNEYVQNVRL